MQNPNYLQARGAVLELLMFHGPCEYARLEEVCATHVQCMAVVANMLRNREITVDARGMIRTNVEAPGL